MQNRTTIVIAHRLSTLASMDRILVFHRGCILEDGTIEELLEKNGHFAAFWNIQQKKGALNPLFANNT
jgi:ATP-binding cassette subfamily B protein